MAAEYLALARLAGDPSGLQVCPDAVTKCPRLQQRTVRAGFSVLLQLVALRVQQTRRDVEALGQLVQPFAERFLGDQ